VFSALDLRRACGTAFSIGSLVFIFWGDGGGYVEGDDEVVVDVLDCLATLLLPHYRVMILFEGNMRLANPMLVGEWECISLQCSLHS
jgi:hypothetical protein